MFEDRCSFFDTADERSWANKSELRGFIVMFKVLTAVFIIDSITRKYLESGIFIEGSFIAMLA